jgi:phosphate transport system substrate-binding protein
MKNIVKGANKRAYVQANVVLLTALFVLNALPCFAGGRGGAGFDGQKPVNVISREDGSGTRGAFIELFGIELRGADGSRKDMTTKEAVIAKQTDVMMTAVAGDRYAVGYISLGSLNETVKAVSIGGVAATAVNVKNGTYPVSRPFFIATKGEPKPPAQDFINFMKSAEGQAIAAVNYIALDDAAQGYRPANVSGKIVVAGSSSVTPLMEKLSEAYRAKNPSVSIEIQQSDSSAGLSAAINGVCDIAMASRSLRDAEKAELTGVAIALDGIAVIINKENPQSNLTKEQVFAIFTGKTTRWAETGAQ